MYDDTDVIETSDDGKLRVILEHDPDCAKPMDEDEGWITSVLVLRSSAWGYDMEAEYDPEGRLSVWRDFNVYRQVPDADAAFIRYMRIFHDTEVFETGWGSDGTRALAWIEPSERERVGIPDTYPSKDAVDIEIDQHRAWANGECYGYIVQEWSDGACGHQDCDEHQEWRDTEDACWGFIGREYAETEATEALAGHRD